MTQKEKELLLKDLCARVPYHPKGRVVNNYNGAAYEEWLTCATFTMFTSITNNCRLYLRPMSSMTEEEQTYWDYVSSDGGWGITEGLISECADWLNTHHFDYRGLIEKGLAIEVTKENNPYK